MDCKSEHSMSAQTASSTGSCSPEQGSKPIHRQYMTQVACADGPVQARQYQHALDTLPAATADDPPMAQHSHGQRVQPAQVTPQHEEAKERQQEAVQDRAHKHGLHPTARHVQTQSQQQQEEQHRHCVQEEARRREAAWRQQQLEQERQRMLAVQDEARRREAAWHQQQRGQQDRQTAQQAWHEEDWRQQEQVRMRAVEAEAEQREQAWRQQQHEREQALALQHKAQRREQAWWQRQQERERAVALQLEADRRERAWRQQQEHEHAMALQAEADRRERAWRQQQLEAPRPDGPWLQQQQAAGLQAEVRQQAEARLMREHAWRQPQRQEPQAMQYGHAPAHVPVEHEHVPHSAEFAHRQHWQPAGYGAHYARHMQAPPARAHPPPPPRQWGP